MNGRILLMEKRDHCPISKSKCFYAVLVIISLLSTGCTVVNTAQNASEPEATPYAVDFIDTAYDHAFVSGDNTYILVAYSEWEGGASPGDNSANYSIYRNDIGAIDTSTDAKDKSAWNLILVNALNPLPGSFSVNLLDIGGGHAIDRRAYANFLELMDDARAEGLSPIVCSSYRTAAKQTQLFNKQIDKFLAQGYPLANAKLEAAKWVAAPGTSEHQTGLALDIVAYNYQHLDEAQENTAEQKWLMQNAHRYGFILRYPQDKSDVTGIHYEPWHYRYVGIEAATAIHEAGLCLEEYLDTI